MEFARRLGTIRDFADPNPAKIKRQQKSIGGQVVAARIQRVLRAKACSKLASIAITGSLWTQRHGPPVKLRHQAGGSMVS